LKDHNSGKGAKYTRSRKPVKLVGVSLNMTKSDALTRDNNPKFLEKLLNFYQNTIPGLEDLTIKNLECEGCLSDNISFVMIAEGISVMTVVQLLEVVFDALTVTLTIQKRILTVTETRIEH
jgi:hypothetical protein